LAGNASVRTRAIGWPEYLRHGIAATSDISLRNAGRREATPPMSAPQQTVAPAANLLRRAVVSTTHNALDMIRPITLAAFAASCLFTAPLGAQNCLGFPSFAPGKFALTASMSSGNEQSTLTAEANAGSSAGTFLGFNVARTEFSNSPRDATSIGGHAGYAFKSQPSSPFVICPIGRITRTFGPDFSVLGVSTETNSLHLSGGVAVGGNLITSQDFAALPFVGANFFHFRTTTETAGVESSDTENYFTLIGGFGFSFGNTFTITPSGAIPLGLEGADPSFLLSVRVNFGNR
jgi:hypothetical protein